MEILYKFSLIHSLTLAHTHTHTLHKAPFKFATKFLKLVGHTNQCNNGIDVFTDDNLMEKFFSSFYYFLNQNEDRVMNNRLYLVEYCFKWTIQWRLMPINYYLYNYRRRHKIHAAMGNNINRTTATQRTGCSVGVVMVRCGQTPLILWVTFGIASCIWH